MPRTTGSVSPRLPEPFHEVCHEYTKFIIENTKDLTILSKMETNFEHSNREIPSWVPDLRFPRGTIAEPGCLAKVAFLGDRAMIVEGVILGQCVAVTQPMAPDSDIELGVLLSRFEAGILHAACEVRQAVFKDVLTSWLETFTNPDGVHPINIVTMRAVYGYLLKAERIELSEIEDDAKQTLVRGELITKIAATLHVHLSLYSHLLAGDGTVAQLNRPHFLVLPGDTLCLFRGSVDVSLIRPCGSEYEFIGNCRIRCDTSREAYDDEYFSRRQVTQFTLI